jgi:hypothetical protein
MDLLSAWKDMKFTKNDLDKLRTETLKAIWQDIVPKELDPKATKANMIETLQPLLRP